MLNIDHSRHLEDTSEHAAHGSLLNRGVSHEITEGLDLVGFYGISTIVGYLMPNPLYSYISNIYDLVGLGFMAYQPL